VRTVCVFCGAGGPVDGLHVDAARALGAEVAARGLRLVTGGGRVGLMGAVASAALDAGGEAIGVIPRFLVDRERAHPGLTALHVVDTLHERKALMHDMSDAFAALPGGFGTLDELAEAVTWRQLGLHDKPLGLLDVDGYWSGLVAFLERARSDGFLHGAAGDLLVVDRDAAALLDRLGAGHGGGRPAGPPPP
jgi:uncharacterized protein (TIGR00730 family)